MSSDDTNISEQHLPPIDRRDQFNNECIPMDEVSGTVNLSLEVTSGTNYM